jgi:hypothetical protein
MAEDAAEAWRRKWRRVSEERGIDNEISFPAGRRHEQEEEGRGEADA